MVVKIMEPASTSAYSLEYNEKKCSKGEAMLLHTSGIDASLGVAGTFERLERGSIRATNLGFHMSVNPGSAEYLSDDEMLSFINDMMSRMGYSNQPYVVYKHSDIDRAHFHVVSVRVNSSGYKIPDFQENRRCLESLAQLAPAYGLTVGNGDGRKYAALGIDPRRFCITSGNVMEQIRIISQECCKYHFSSMAQFCRIMQSHGLDVQERNSEPLEFVVRGLNQADVPCTAPFTEGQIGVQLGKEVERRLEECARSGGVKKREKGRISGISTSCLEYSTSERHFKNMLARYDIDLFLHRTKDGRIYGATFVDHSTRCAFKCSELGSFSLDSIIKAERDGQWSKPVQPHHEQQDDQDLNLVGAALAAVGKSNSKSQEKDMKDDPKKKRRMKR